MTNLKDFCLPQFLSLSDVIRVTVSLPINQGDGNRPSDWWDSRMEMFRFLKPLRALSVHTVKKRKKKKMELSPDNRTCCSAAPILFFNLFSLLHYNKLRRKLFYFLSCISNVMLAYESNNQCFNCLKQTRHNWIFQLFSSSSLPVLSAYLTGILRDKCIIASAFLQCA